MHPFLEGVKALAVEIGGVVVPIDDVRDGDIPLRFDGEILGGFRPNGLDGALDRLIEQTEREFGCSLPQLDRKGKQEVVRRLDELGAFNLRKAVEDIADRLEVSRFTVYNYLNSANRVPLPTGIPGGSRPDGEVQ